MAPDIGVSIRRLMSGIRSSTNFNKIELMMRIKSLAVMNTAAWALAMLGQLASIDAFAQSADVPIPAAINQAAMQSKKTAGSAQLGVTQFGQRLVTVGERGIILLSDDAGKNFRQAKVPVSVSLTAVQFVDDKTGWAVGHMGIVLRTDDGGETWTKQLDGMQAASIALETAKRKAGQNEDSPMLWEAQRLMKDGPDKPFLDLYFSDKQTGFIVGAYNLIFRTDDGGKTWQSLMNKVENPKGLNFYGIRAAGTVLYVAGERGLLLRSTDNGSSFQALASPYQGSFFGVLTTRSGEVITYGLRGNAYRSNDQGETWKKIETGTEAALSAGIELPDGAIVLASQVGEVFFSRSSGQDFHKLPIKGMSSVAAIASLGRESLVLAGLQGIKVIQAGVGTKKQ